MLIKIIKLRRKFIIISVSEIGLCHKVIVTWLIHKLVKLVNGFLLRFNSEAWEYWLDHCFLLLWWHYIRSTSNSNTNIPHVGNNVSSIYAMNAHETDAFARQGSLSRDTDIPGFSRGDKLWVLLMFIGTFKL